jgi:hypothetical protein
VDVQRRHGGIRADKQQHIRAGEQQQRGAMKRRIWLVVSLATGLAAVTVLGADGAMAQSPAPNAYFEQWAPGSYGDNTNGLQVEGVGSLGCGPSESSIEAQTVYDINTDRQATISELSPQSICGSISQYESLVSQIASYVEANAGSRAVRLWGGIGILLDEEPGFGFSYSQLVTLNESVYNTMLNTPGVSFWYEDQGNCPGCWTQSQYDNLTYNASVGYDGIPAPQVYNSFMAGQANASGFNYQMVICPVGAYYPYDVGCSAGMYPYTNGSYAAASIAGSPYDQQFGTSYGFKWEEVFQ